LAARGGRRDLPSGKKQGRNTMIDTSVYERLAFETSAFRDIELEMIKDAMQSWSETPGKPYHESEILDGRILAGFCLLSKAGNTDYTYDVSAFCVDPGYRDKGIGKRLLEQVEADLLSREATAILRFEISTQKLESMGADLLPSSGYTLIGHIADFYETGNDYYIYARHLYRPRPGRPVAVQPRPEADQGIPGEGDRVGGETT
jgi:ribosomal protein S18 acetylase RimI-like enzyme